MGLIKKSFRVELEEKPKTSEEISIEILKHFEGTKHNIEFIYRKNPVSFSLDGIVYNAELKRILGRGGEGWALDCKEV